MKCVKVPDGWVFDSIYLQYCLRGISSHESELYHVCDPISTFWKSSPYRLQISSVRLIVTRRLAVSSRTAGITMPPTTASSASSLWCRQGTLMILQTWIGWVLQATEQGVQVLPWQETRTWWLWLHTYQVICWIWVMYYLIWGSVYAVSRPHQVHIGQLFQHRKVFAILSSGHEFKLQL